MSRIKNYLGLTPTQFDAIVNAYILDCIPTNEEIKSGWDFITIDDKGRVNFAMHCFETEYNYEQNKKRWPSIQERLAQWLMGLPSALNIEYRNHAILELAVKWGRLPTDATEKAQDKIISNWFNFMAFKFLQLHRKVNK